jgi:hypothetical protein
VRSIATKQIQFLVGSLLVAARLKSIHIPKAVLISGLLFCTTAQANCLNPNADTRLRTYCVAETLVGNAVTLGDAMLLDTLLKREGYAAGLGLPNPVERSTTQTFVSPVLDYNTNINGGNPNRPLVLGGLTFTGDEQNLRRSGAVAGFGAGANGRHIYGDGRYLDYAASASYTYSPQHSMGIARSSANLCSRNHVANQWYVDACGDTTRLVRDLAAETNSGLSLSTAKLFSTGNGAFHSTSIGVRRNYAEQYQQNQIQLGWNTVRNRGAYTGFNFSFGEAVPNQLAQRRSASATVGTTVFNRALSATASYSYADGGRLLGFERNDTTRSVSISYTLTRNLSVTVGYRTVDSTIDYFSEREPIVSVHFAPIRF